MFLATAAVHPSGAWLPVGGLGLLPGGSELLPGGLGLLPTSCRCPQVLTPRRKHVLCPGKLCREPVAEGRRCTRCSPLLQASSVEAGRAVPALLGQV